MNVKLSGIKEKGFADELEEYLKRKTKSDVKRSGDSFEVPEGVKRSKVLDVVRWFISRKSMQAEIRVVRKDGNIELKRVET